ncbi:polysaccharide lyase family 7 protein [Zobellia alginiliquefaciens]|uniref:polysaccharide lyase family 7 protein n=1 Tax=Zobellia alginiliquefaciens TaxID=3032586 RepID=UPI0023E36612|nr:polysaccharide lyase family 7 protein [Zobellia alginiliquefaciens]
MQSTTIWLIKLITKKVLILIMLFNIISCDKTSDTIEQETIEKEEVEEEIETTEELAEEEEEEEVEEEYFLPNIDLSNWKVTLPIGAPDEVEPPEISSYATDARLLPYMYNDSTDGSLVFYALPNSSTANSSYSRTELREQMVPGSNNTNWTFSQGGRMKGTLEVPEITRDAEGKYHRTIIMQIHGRLTNEQKERIGEDDNNAPPILKVYWQNGKIRILTKVLKDINASDEEILHTNAWEDNDGYTFSEEIGTNKFTLEIIASEGKLEIVLNETDSVVYQDIHMDKWGVFENYFKAGNYLQSRDEGSYARVKYYTLEVSH